MVCCGVCVGVCVHGCAVQEEATKAYLESLGHVALGSHRVVQAARRDFRQLKASTDAALADALHRREYDTSRACMSKSQAYDSHAGLWEGVDTMHSVTGRARPAMTKSWWLVGVEVARGIPFP